MSAADHTHKPVDALAELLAEEATSEWLPSIAGPTSAALPLSELADTADLPRESMQSVATAGRRAMRRRRQATTPAAADSEAAQLDGHQAVDVADVEPPAPMVARAPEQTEAQAIEASAPAKHRASDERPLNLPRGPRPGSAQRAADSAPAIELARGPRPAQRATPAAPSPTLRVLAPVDAPATSHERPAHETPVVDALDALLEDLKQHEAAELEPELAAAHDDGGGEDAAPANRLRPSRRPLVYVLAASAVAAATVTGFTLAQPDPANVARLHATPMPDVAAAAAKAVKQQLDQQRHAAQAAKHRAARRRAAERRRREQRQRAARRRAQQRRAAAAAPAAPKPSVPARVAPAPRISTPTMRQPSAPTCHSDLGPC